MVRRKSTQLGLGGQQAQATNETGLAALPAELLLEISLWFRPSSTRTGSSEFVSPSELQTIRAFRALSQTSQRLRLFFLPFAWERVLVCPESNSADSESSPKEIRLSQKQLATELVAQLETVVIRTDILSDFVHSMTFTLSEYCEDRVIPELTRSLSLLNNLRVLCILDAPSRNSRRSKDLFESASLYKYPGIRRLTVPPRAITIAWSCRNLQQLILSGPLWGERGNVLKKVTRGQLSFVSLANATPNLRSFICESIDVSSVFHFGLSQLPPTLEELGFVEVGYSGFSSAILEKLASHPSLLRMHFALESDSEPTGTITANAYQVARAERKLQEAAQLARTLMISKKSINTREVYVTLGFSSDGRKCECGPMGWEEVEELKMVEYM
uniref:F-box domain-containing protein n=1 Tax=Mycena chlorophos TaxID=658473 RepID=A0ABQ0LKM4_MYCCL|nr:predicted protein [Mycena chlorophos]